jgi:hypothetical protein
MRALRRQLRIWKNDFLSFWLRLTTFHRTVLGLAVAFAIVFAARNYWFDPLLVKIADATKKLEKSEPPPMIPNIKEDADIIEALLKIEAREKNLKERKQEVERIAKNRPRITQENKASILAEFGTLISQANLRLLGNARLTEQPAPVKPVPPPSGNSKKKTAAPEPETPPVNSKNDIPNEVYEYVIEGNYANMLAFLNRAEKFPYPVKINHFLFGYPEVDSSITSKIGTKTSMPLESTGNRQLQLKFRLTIYFH